MTPRQILLISLWVGAVTGLGEFSILAVKKLILHQFIQMSRQVVWMAPVADAILFSLAGLGLAFLAWRRPAWVSPFLVLLVNSTLAYLSLLLMFPAINEVAVLLLAAGLGMQTSRLLSRNWEGVNNFVRRSIGPLFAGLSLTALVTIMVAG